MRDVTISKFKQMTVKQIKESGSYNLVADGQFVAIVVVPASAEKRFQIQSLCSQMNAALGLG